MKRISVEDFKALTRAHKLGLPDPTPPKKRKRAAGLWEQSLRIPADQRCGPHCAEGCRLYHEVTVALAALTRHVERHRKGEA